MKRTKARRAIWIYINLKVYLKYRVDHRVDNSSKSLQYFSQQNSNYEILSLWKFYRISIWYKKYHHSEISNIVESNVFSKVIDCLEKSLASSNRKHFQTNWLRKTIEYKKMNRVQNIWTKVWKNKAVTYTKTWICKISAWSFSFYWAALIHYFIGLICKLDFNKYLKIK